MNNPYAPPDPTKPRPAPRPASPRPVRRPAPPRTPPTPEQMAEVSKGLLGLGLVLLGAILTARLPIPWQVAAPVLATWAVVLGVRLLVRFRTVGIRGMMPVFVTVAMGLSGLLLLSSLTMLSMWSAQVERQECLDSALTISAQEACERAFQDALAERYPTGD